MNTGPVIVSRKPTQEDIKFLDDRLYEHNSSRTGSKDGNEFAKMIYDRENNIIAGLSGWTWAGACEIVFFWIKEEYRSQGWGRLLLQAAEEEAKMNECKVVLVRSFDFQAPPFYQKFGYHLEHKLEDFPPGHIEYWLIKRLNRAII